MHGNGSTLALSSGRIVGAVRTPHMNFISLTG
jgi:hypothetical protein